MDNGNGVGTTMLVSPTAGQPIYNGGGFGDFGGGNGIWMIVLFFLFAMLGGWNNGGYNGQQPVIVNDSNGGYANVQRGFDQSAIMSGINGVQNSVNSLGTQVCNGFGNVQTAICGVNQNMSNGFNAAEIAANGRQMQNMQQAFAAQTAVMQGFNNAGAQLSDLKYTVAQENCADRAAGEANTRAIIDSQTRGTQAILDKLCALELDGVKSQVAAEQRENANLRTELMYAREQASQIEQTAQIENNLYNRLKNCPVGTTPVYGNQPIFTCPNNGYNGCGCGA